MSSSELKEKAIATNDQYQALFAVADAIASHRDLSALFHELGNRLARVVSFDSLSLVLHDASTNVMRLHVLVTSESLAEPFTMELSPDDDPAGQVWQTQQALIISTLSEWRRWPVLFARAEQYGMQSGCWLPLTTARRRLGDIISGCEDWVSVAAYGQNKRVWLGTFLDLPNGIPSHDTFGEVFSRLNPDAFETCFRAWMQSMVELSGGRLVAIDGKSIRRSFEHGWDKSGMTHIVSAFVQANRMVFAQEKTDGKGRELEAIEKLLGMLDLQGAVVTIDAIGGQREIAASILQAKADYVLQVKGNQSQLQQAIVTLIDEALLDQFKDLRSDHDQQTEGDHGRIETRQVHVTWDVERLGEIAGKWPGLKSIAVVDSMRDVEGTISRERYYYISSLDARGSARQFGGYIRGHWSVENNLHWQLDVSFNEDQRRIRKGHGAENFSRLCRISLNLLKNGKSQKVGIATKRKICGWNNDYLIKVAQG